MTFSFLPSLLRLLTVVSGGCMLLTSCQKNNAIIETNYPDQGIYMTQSSVAIAVNNGVYEITPNIYNQAQRSVTDVAGGKFNIPLGIYRSGINKDNSYSISIGTNTDSINKLIAANKFFVYTDPLLTTELLPASAYTLPTTIDLPGGSDNATFALSINLPFLISNYTNTPKKRYAVAVSIATSKASAIKTALATTVILINPSQVVAPVSNFTTYVAYVTKTVSFFNLAANGISYSWSFGDNTPVSTDASPNHVYAASGTYTVSLTTTGITGSGAPSVKTSTVVIP